MIEAFVDIDGTLWDFRTHFISRLSKKAGVPVIDDSYHIDETKYGLSENDIRNTIDSIFEDQYLYTPFQDSEELLYTLRKSCDKISIVSHRDQMWTEDLEDWLEQHQLLNFCDNVICTKNKKHEFMDITKLNILVDDAREVLEDAENHAHRFAIEYYYNVGIPGVHYGKNLTELIPKINHVINMSGEL